MRVNDQHVNFNVFNTLQYSDEGMGNCSVVTGFESMVHEQLLMVEKEAKVA